MLPVRLPVQHAPMESIKTERTSPVVSHALRRLLTNVPPQSALPAHVRGRTRTHINKGIGAAAPSLYWRSRGQTWATHLIVPILAGA